MLGVALGLLALIAVVVAVSVLRRRALPGRTLTPHPRAPRRRAADAATEAEREPEAQTSSTDVDG